MNKNTRSLPISSLTIVSFFNPENSIVNSQIAGTVVVNDCVVSNTSVVVISIGASVVNSIGASVVISIGASVVNSIGASVVNSIGASVVISDSVVVSG